MKEVITLGSFDDLKVTHMRFLQEAARLGNVHVLLMSDQLVEKHSGHPPKFPQAEREYFVDAIRYVNQITLIDNLMDLDELPREFSVRGAIWSVDEHSDQPAKREFCQAESLEYRLIPIEQTHGYCDPNDSPPIEPTGKPKVIVTGCYDWFHSGHVRFFEEVSELGDLYVVVGHDANIKLLKGDGHPMFSEQQRQYMAGSIRFVKQALVSSGHGWLDAEPEIEKIKPDIYAVNEDGDQPDKRNYCEAHGIEYRILKRTPKDGLPARQSTHLRGF